MADTQVMVTPRQAVAMIKPKLKEPKNLPRPIKKAMVKGLKQLEVTQRKIAKIMQIDQDTVKRYIDEAIEDEYLQYSDAVQKIFKEKNDTLKILAAEAMRQKFKDTEKTPLRDITGAYKVLHEVERAKPGQATNNGNLVTINVHPSMKSYSVDKTVVIDGEEQRS